MEWTKEVYLLVAHRPFSSGMNANIIKKLKRVGNPVLTGITSETFGGADLLWMTKVEGSRSSFLVGDTHNFAFVGRSFRKPSAVLKAPIKAKQSLVKAFSYHDYLVLCLIHQTLVLKGSRLVYTSPQKCASYHHNLPMLDMVDGKVVFLTVLGEALVLDVQGLPSSSHLMPIVEHKIGGHAKVIGKAYQVEVCQQAKAVYHYGITADSQSALSKDGVVIVPRIKSEKEIKYRMLLLVSCGDCLLSGFDTGEGRTASTILKLITLEGSTLSTLELETPERRDNFIYYKVRGCCITLKRLKVVALLNDLNVLYLIAVSKGLLQLCSRKELPFTVRDFLSVASKDSRHASLALLSSDAVRLLKLF